MTIRRPPLDLRELLVVRVIASEGSIHGAARMLGGKQSALSRSLRLLEERLGVQLFRRTSSGTKLTPAGTAFLKEAEELLDGTTRLYEHTRRWSVGRNGIISVGIQGSVPPGRISDMLKPYSLTEPGISFVWQDAARSDLLQALKEGTIDLAVVTLPSTGIGMVPDETKKYVTRVIRLLRGESTGDPVFDAGFVDPAHVKTPSGNQLFVGPFASRDATQDAPDVMPIFVQVMRSEAPPRGLFVSISQRNAG